MFPIVRQYLCAQCGGLFVREQLDEKDLCRKCGNHGDIPIIPPTLPKDNTLIPWEEHVEKTYKCKCFKCPGLYANEVIKFVGFRGSRKYISKGHAKGYLCQLDIKGQIFEGEVFPKPVVTVTDDNIDNLVRLTGKTEDEIGDQYFLGILGYEIEVMTLIFTLEGMRYNSIMVLMPRGVGKTYIEDWENGFRMKFFREQLLLLSESDVLLKVGNWIYNWAFLNKYLADSQKGAKQGTYQHFTLHNQGSLDIYGYMDKRTLGGHNIRIIMDDVVNLDWRNRPTDDQRARDQWDSNLNNMIRTGVKILGTRKYEGDLLHHFMTVIRNIVIIKMSPFIRCKHPEEHYGYDESGNILDNRNKAGTYDPCPKCRNEALLSPEIHSYEEYMDKMEANYESWFAEQMQDPHPRAGGMVEEGDIFYENMPKREEVKLCGIGVDVAKVWDDTTLSDMTAVIGCIMWGEKDEHKQEHRRFTFHKEDIRRMPYRNTVDRKGKMIRGIIETIDKQWKWYRKNYPDHKVIIAIERDGPGITLIDQILREDWEWKKSIIADKGKAVKWTKEGRTNVRLGINHQGQEKIARVNSELRHSIKHELPITYNDGNKPHQIGFTHNLEDTTFMSQLLSFPKGKHDDGPDAAGMIKDELNRRWSPVVDTKPRGYHAEKRKEKLYARKFQEMQEPWRKDQRKAKLQQRRLF